MDASIPSRPLIDEITPLSALYEEYENGSSNFLIQIDWLKNMGYISFRRTRGRATTKLNFIRCLTQIVTGDGDCFYRCTTLSSQVLRAHHV
jgi:hypothetical protein